MAEPIKVKRADGVVVTFPAGTPPDAIKAALGGGAPEPFNPLKMAKEAITSTAEGAVDLVTGRKEKEPGISELPASVLGARRDGRGMMLGAALDFARDDKARADIIKKYYPQATTREDPGGNLIFGIPQEDGTVVEGYGNRPGLSMQDINEAAAAGLIEAPLALALRRFGPFGVGAGVAGGSVATDKVAQSQGSEQPVDWTTAAISGIVGTVGEMLPIDRVLTYFQKRRYFSGDELTKEGRNVLSALGVDPDRATKEFVDRMKSGYVKTGDPKAAVNRATLETLPVPIQGTPGDISRRKSQQLLEDAAEKGSMGRMAESQAAGLRARQQDALRENLDAIGQQIRGDNPNVGVQESGALVQNALTQQRDAAQGVVNKAYDVARASKAGIAPDQMSRMSTAIRAAANERSGQPIERFSVHAKGVIDDFDEILGRLDSADASILLTDLYDWRKKARKVASSAYGRDDYTYQAVKGAMDGFDAEVKRLAENSLIDGSQDAVEAWSKALAANAEFKGTFGAKDIIGRLLEPNREAGKGVLKVAPEDASKLIFGLSDTEFATKPGVASAMVRLREVLGPQSAEWSALRQETFGRFLQSALGQYDGDVASRAISGAKFSTAFDKAMTNGKGVMSAMFSPKELALLEQFKRAALLVTQRERNTSNSASALVNTVQKLLTLDVFGPRVMASLQLVPGLGDLLSGIRYGAGQAAASWSLRPAPAFSGIAANSLVTPMVAEQE